METSMSIPAEDRKERTTFQFCRLTRHLGSSCWREVRFPLPSCPVASLGNPRAPLRKCLPSHLAGSSTVALQLQSTLKGINEASVQVTDTPERTMNPIYILSSFHVPTPPYFLSQQHHAAPHMRLS